MRGALAGGRNPDMRSLHYLEHKDSEPPSLILEQSLTHVEMHNGHVKGFIILRKQGDRSVAEKFV